VTNLTIYLLGLDGASMNTIQETLDRVRLPNIERLITNKSFGNLKSVYPYVTAPAWTTIFSGVNPGKHGIFEMFEVREKKTVPSNMRSTDVPLLWDYLTWANKKILVAGIPFIYPAPKVNGIFVSGRFAPKLSCYPSDTMTRFDLQGFNYDDLSMEEKTEKILVEGSGRISDKILEGLNRRIQSISAMLDSESWDVCIVVEGLPDDILHLSYGDNAVVDEMYQKLDELIGVFLKRLSTKDSLIIFSDHGFCKVEKVLFLNEWLLKKNYTTFDASEMSKFLMWLGLDWESLEKDGFTSKVFRFVLEHFPWVAERVENSLRSGMVVDGSRRFTDSKVSSFSINEPLAWIRFLEKNGVSQESLLAELGDLKNQGLLKNVFEVDKIYNGRYVRFAPGKILVEAPDGWAIDTLRWNRGKLIGKPLYTKRGVHRREGVLMVAGKDLNLESARVHDIVPTVLDLLKLPIPESIDGETLAKPASKEPRRLLNVTQRL
jgi:predicted AlkP superfamily phosphohydrolase/phosphomutase